MRGARRHRHRGRHHRGAGAEWLRLAGLAMAIAIAVAWRRRSVRVARHDPTGAATHDERRRGQRMSVGRGLAMLAAAGRHLHFSDARWNADLHGSGHPCMQRAAERRPRLRWSGRRHCRGTVAQCGGEGVETGGLREELRSCNGRRQEHRRVSNSNSNSSATSPRMQRQCAHKLNARMRINATLVSHCKRAAAASSPIGRRIGRSRWAPVRCS